MKKYDLIVIGAGSGLTVSSEAAEKGWKVAVVEPGPFGGTCLNRGCIPSKMLIHSADVAEDINRAHLFGVKQKGFTVSWKPLVNRVSRIVDKDAKEIEAGNREAKNIDVYKTTGRFVGPKQLKVGKAVITAKHIVIAAGTRPSVPPIPGLDKAPYMTSTEALRLQRQPKHLVVIGGGYISAELAHFYGGLGTKVTILQRGDLLVNNEDEDISQAFTEIYKKRFDVLLGADTKRVSHKGKTFTLDIEVKGTPRKLTCDALLVATGRKSNADLLDAAKTGVKLTERGNYIQVDAYMETNVPGIWALGDIAGKYFFKHSANLEAEYVLWNLLNPERKRAVNYTAMPHAIFAGPQVAGVGETEQELRARKADYAVGRYRYYHTGMGHAFEDQDGFVKVLADRKTRAILGCHILGTDASTLIHEVIVAMRHGLTVDAILDTIYVHPALPEVVQRAFGSIEW